jgi:hypothetical protein
MTLKSAPKIVKKRFGLGEIVLVLQTVLCVAERAHTVQSVHERVAQAESPLYKDSYKVANPLQYCGGGGEKEGCMCSLFLKGY